MERTQQLHEGQIQFISPFPPPADCFYGGIVFSCCTCSAQARVYPCIRLTTACRPNWGLCLWSPFMDFY